MLSFAFRRVLSHPGIFSIAQRLPTRAISLNRSFAIGVQRNLTTTASDRNSDSAADSKPEPESNPKSTRRKTGSSPKTAGKDKKKKKKKAVTRKDKKEKKKAVTKKKVTVSKEALPPKAPANYYALWLRDWISTQPKVENLEGAQVTVKKGAQIWNTVSEHEKQQYREKSRALRDEYRERLREWRENVDPAVLRELNRRRVAKGRLRIRGLRRPMNGFVRYSMHVRAEYPRTEGDYKTYFKNVAARAGSQWRAMSDAEKAQYNDRAKLDLDAWHEDRAKRAKSQAKA